MDQVVFALHGDTTHFAEDFVIKFIFYLYPHPDDTIGQVDLIQKGFLHIGAIQPDRIPGNIPDMTQFLHFFPDLIEDLFLQFVIRRKHFRPFWNEELYLAYREFIENVFQDSGNVFSAKLFTVGCDSCNTVFLLEFLRQFQGFFFIGKLGVYKDQERFLLLFQFLYSLFFCFRKVFSGKFPEAAVCCDHKSYGGMIFDNFAGT